MICVWTVHCRLKKGKSSKLLSHFKTKEDWLWKSNSDPQIHLIKQQKILNRPTQYTSLIKINTSLWWEIINAKIPGFTKRPHTQGMSYLGEQCAKLCPQLGRDSQRRTTSSGKDQRGLLVMVAGREVAETSTLDLLVGLRQALISN